MTHLPPPSIESLISGVRAGERAALARAITLIESKRPDHQHSARRLVQTLLPHTGAARRVGITGAPGVGKSTTIDALGSYLTGLGHKVAVLAVDPSSARTGGSILADKTRMARLAADPGLGLQIFVSAFTTALAAKTGFAFTAETGRSIDGIVNVGTPRLVLGGLRGSW